MSSEASSIAGTQQLGNLDPDLRRQRDLDRGQHRDRVQRGRRRALRGLRLARPDGRLDPRRPRQQLGLPARTSRPCTTRSSRPSASPTGRASSGSARSSAGRPPTSRTPSRPTATPSATTRWPPPRRSSASTPTRPSRCRRPSSSTPARRSSAARPRGPSGRRRTTRGRASRPPTSTSTSGCRPGPSPPAGTPTCRPSRPTRRAWRPARPAARSSTPSPREVPELWGGSADLAESNNTTIEGAPSFLPKDRSARLWKGDPSPAGCCTSASASTPWARS